MMEGFIKHNFIRLEQFEIILDEMKNDHQDLENNLPDESYVIVEMRLDRNVHILNER